MEGCNCSNINKVCFDIVQINSFEKFSNVTDVPTMIIGKNSCEYLYRILIKFHLKQLPINIKILDAEMSFIVINKVLNSKTNKLEAFALNSDWDPHRVNWCNQPSLDYNKKLFEKAVNKNNKYYINITEQITNWYDNPSSNYGMILKGNEDNEYSKIQICTSDGSICNLSLRVKYLVKQDIHVIVEQTQFLEYSEKVIVEAGVYFTMLRDISKTKTVAYAVENNAEVPIEVVLEYSPDGINIMKEDRIICIKPRTMEIVFPIWFSKYIRLAIFKPKDGNQAIINTWLQLQI
jgi:hypothetical protein